MAYYSPTGNPQQQTRGTSPQMRDEFALIAAGFALLPVPAAIAAGASNYAGLDTGAANAYVVSLSPAILTSYTDGMVIRFKAANANTGASTVNLNSLGLKGIQRPDGTALVAGDITANSIVAITYNSTTGTFLVGANLIAYMNAAAASAVAAGNFATAAANSATASANSATASANSAAAAATYSAALQGTSSTSLAISIATKIFTVNETNRQWGAGQYIIAASAANNTNYMHGQVLSLVGTTLTLAVQDTGGSGTFADWVLTIAGTQGPLGPSGTITQPYLPRTSNTQLLAGNRGAFVDITSGAFTQTFDTAANLGAGWNIRIRNASTGEITVTSDGLTYIMYGGEVRDFNSDGTTLRSVVVQPFYVAYVASATFTKPPGYTFFDGLLWGSGAGGASSAAGVGGGGGSCLPFRVLASALSASNAIVIGAGPAAGTAGNNSTFAGLTSYGGGASGGGAGVLGAGDAVASALGGRPNSDFSAVTTATLDNQGFGGGNAAGFGGGSEAAANSVYGGGGGAKAGSTGSPATNTGGKSVYGGGGGGSGSGGVQGPGGTSVFGGSGGAGNSATAGAAGTAPGGGGGSGTTGGAGARGEMRIWGVA